VPDLPHPDTPRHSWLAHVPWKQFGKRHRPSPAPPIASSRPERVLQLALQGGGAHGAFTWGVLERLLKDPTIVFEAISGSSAGAMNAVVMASGWRQGGRKGARLALENFWGEVGEQMPESVARLMGLELPSFGALSNPTGHTMAGLMHQFMQQLSPQQFNPLDHNPLRDILLSQVDFEALRADAPFRLHVAATQVRTGRLTLFREHELTVDHVLASACLPTLHHTIHIDGEAYWDGGFSANPALFPLIERGQSKDLLMVLLNPPLSEVATDSRQAIDQRLAALSFSTHLMRELDMIETLQRRARKAWWPSAFERRLRDLRLHWIDVSEVDALRSHDTKLLACTPFLEDMRDQGMACANRWLKQEGRHVGQRSGFEMAALV
jgi:NTE family protein